MPDPDSPALNSHVGGAWIPGWVLHHPDLSLTLKVLAGRLCALSRRDGACTASNAYLSEDLSISERQIRRHLRSLKEADVIGVEVENAPPHGSRRRIFILTPRGGRTKPSGGGGRNRPGGEDETVRSSFIEDKRGSKENTGELFPELSTTDPPDPVENVVEAVWEATLEAWKDRVGDQPGPDLKPTDGRLSKIRARSRECLQAGMQPQEAIRYLTLAAQGFYADDWERRDEYLDPGRYCFADDEKVRGWVREGRQEELGLSDADVRFARRYERLMEREARREDSA